MHTLGFLRESGPLSLKSERSDPLGGPRRSFEGRKGIRLNIPESGFGYFYGDVTELGDDDRCPGKSSLFSLTLGTTLESYRTEIGSDLWQS
jgi:hypothetical protein